MKMTPDDILLMEFRKSELQKELRRIEDTVSGRSFRFIPFITDENGNISGKLIDSLISELLAPVNDRGLMKKDGERFREHTANDLALYSSFCTAL